MRRIVFSAEETLQAIRSYARVAPQAVLHGRVLGFRLCAPETPEDGGLAVSVELDTGTGHTTLEVRLQRPDVLALLIRCCLENNLPIPRLGTKATAVTDGGLTLLIRYDHAAPG